MTQQKLHIKPGESVTIPADDYLLFLNAILPSYSIESAILMQEYYSEKITDNVLLSVCGGELSQKYSRPIVDLLIRANDYIARKSKPAEVVENEQ